MVGMQRDGAVRGRGRPREERVTGAVLTAVVDLVTEQGIGAVTMDAVASRAGVSKPAMYRRWPTKQDLIIAAAETRLGVLSVPDLGDFRAELRLVLTARLEAYRLPGSDRLIAGLIGVAAEAGAARGQYAEYTERITSETRRILERGIDRGDVDPDTDVRAAATLVAAPLLFRLIGEQEMPDARFVETLVELVARAVGPTG
ncbi:TetR/AcrR family transcriptional regulator [Streptomyces chartreusis]|uniref:TetR/AcrR family transcriptional regulator n=1 Tax=Streptomyces chartreusis TaxID=1969 RepID=UPI002E810220|nr:TetR/AcrR family transcriptional regulator [Streptomyces chartreusis]WSZ72380.1 TetR/AcrR family transcriptional regulator [Streptomyces chartreusis]WUB15217.1 TetR/AcrR family transcriptional regulator [Streptomyces chartreusis]